MMTQLKNLVADTVFTFDGIVWQHNGGYWGCANANGSGFYPEIKGKECVRCIPKMGGVFQEKMPKWIAVETEVSVSPSPS